MDATAPLPSLSPFHSTSQTTKFLCVCLGTRSLFSATGKSPHPFSSLADSLYAKSNGTDIHLLGIQEFIRESQRWTARNYGLENYRLEDSFRGVVDELAKGINVKTDWQVREINYEDVGAIKLTNQRGEVRASAVGVETVGADECDVQVLEATRVIITVPHTVLRDKDIKFTPQLPESKITAFESLRMEPGLKVRRDSNAA